MANAMLNQPSKSGGPSMPDLSNIEEIKPDEALKALEPLLKAFNAFASLYKIISLSIKLQGNINSLMLSKETLENEITTMKVERDNLATSQQEELDRLKTAHKSNIEHITNEFNIELNKFTNLKKQQEELTNQLNIQTEQSIKECQEKCDLMLADAATKVKLLETKANDAEERLNKATKDYEIIKSKFQD